MGTGVHGNGDGEKCDGKGEGEGGHGLAVLIGLERVGLVIVIDLVGCNPLDTKGVQCGNEEDGGSSFDVGNNDDIGEQGQHKGQQHDIIKRLTKCGTGQEVICFDVGNDIEEEI